MSESVFSGATPFGSRAAPDGPSATRFARAGWCCDVSMHCRLFSAPVWAQFPEIVSHVKFEACRNKGITAGFTLIRRWAVSTLARVEEADNGHRSRPPGRRNL